MSNPAFERYIFADIKYKSRLALETAAYQPVVCDSHLAAQVE